MHVRRIQRMRQNYISTRDNVHKLLKVLITRFVTYTTGQSRPNGLTLVNIRKDIQIKTNEILNKLFSKPKRLILIIIIYIL